MSRSPKYPSCSLQSALSYAEKAYEKIGNSTVDSSTFIESMGYSGRSGASVSTLAALRYFGLLDGRGEDVKFSELYLRIVRPVEENEAKIALNEAARNPTVFSEFFNEYEILPPKDILKSLAVRKYGFSEKGAKKFTSNLLDTSLLLLNDENNSPNLSEENVSKESSSSLSVETSKSSSTSSIAASDRLKFKLSPDVSAEVFFYGEVDRDILRRLIRHLELTSEIYDE